MPTTDTNVPQVIVNKLTKAQYEAATKSPTEFYAVSDEQIGTSDIADGAVTAAKASFTTYSTSEQVVGTWIDGKPIYRKVIDVGAMPSNSTKQVAHGITDLYDATKIYGSIVHNNHTNYFPLPKLGAEIAVDNTYVYITTDSSSLANFSGYVALEYTKTTD